MNKQIERILICVLWLLAATLGTCFWLNTIFGFNIFSASHWQYLAYLQASQTPVRPTFYISLTCAILISAGILYTLLRPHGLLRRVRKINRARDESITETALSPQASTPIENAPTEPLAPNSAPQTHAPKLQRPPRIGLTINTVPPIPTITQPAPTPQPSVNDINFDELRDIFASNEYVVKRSPQIENFKPALFAIGTDEKVWMGGVGISESVLSNAIDRLATVFSDTLDDIQINIFGFIIAPNGPVSNTDIQTFANISELRTYITSNPNIPPTDAGERENFEAYSEYIDTVINYMDKI